MPMASGPLDEIDLVAGRQRHDRLLPVRAAAGEPAHPLQLALVGGGADGRDLDVEHPLDGGPDLHLVGVRTHPERDGIQRFLLLHRLLGHQRPDEHLTRVPHDASASSSACRARPVPFCFHGFLPPPETSLRPRVSCVPTRRSAISRTTAWWSSGVLISAPKTSDRSSSVPACFPLASRTCTVGIISCPPSSAAAAWWSCSICAPSPARRWRRAPPPAPAAGSARASPAPP